MQTRFSGARQQLVDALFPRGIPALWCPPLTHFRDDGSLDRERIRAHLRFMQPEVRGFLVPGSTGEGWEMSNAEIRALIALFTDALRGQDAHVLIGMLKPTAAEAIEGIRAAVAWLRDVSHAADDAEALARASVRGFTVCAPAGAERTQAEIEAGLDAVRALGYPTALYQLPQVTGNEIAPATAIALARRHPGFYLLKDTSGADRVAASGFRDAFLVRGAEGDYARHLAGAGGAYDGFLLSTANSFGRQLAAMMEWIRRGERDRAEAFSRALTVAITELFDLGGRVGYGNPFTNANKALDHFFAHGAAAEEVAPPLLHSGRRIPRDLVRAAGERLRALDLLPTRGYLEDAP